MADLKTITIQGVGNFQVPATYSDAQVKEHIQGLRMKRPDIFGAPAGVPKAPVPDALSNVAPVDVTPEQYSAMSDEQRAAWDAQDRKFRLGVQLPNELSGAGKGVLNTGAHLADGATVLATPFKPRVVKENKRPHYAPSVSGHSPPRRRCGSFHTSP